MNLEVHFLRDHHGHVPRARHVHGRVHGDRVRELRSSSSSSLHCIMYRRSIGGRKGKARMIRGGPPRWRLRSAT